MGREREPVQVSGFNIVALKKKESKGLASPENSAVNIGRRKKGKLTRN